MNRKIIMLILLALVVGAVLIAYNKWIMRDAYIISTNASSQLAVTNAATDNSLKALVIKKSATDALKTVEDTIPDSKVVLIKKKEAAVSNELTKKNVSSKGIIPAGVTSSEKVLVKQQDKATSTVSSDVSATVPQKKKSIAKSSPAKDVKTALPLPTVEYTKEKLSVQTSALFTYKIFTLNKPQRLVIDVIGRFSEKLSAPNVAEDGLVKAVRLGHHKDRVRIVLDLKKPLSQDWIAERKSDSLVVVIR